MPSLHALPDAHEHADEIESFREEKDRFFRRDDNSPLSIEQQATFSGLAYFPPDVRYRFVLPVLPVSSSDATGGAIPPEVEFETSTGAKVQYRRFGRVRFDVGGRTVELTLFESPDGLRLFVPFRDATSGHETYGGGRYLDVEIPVQNAPVELDFNRAYNPSCAYNEGWTCPLPPAENQLAVRIEAGERNFANGHAPTA